MRRSRTAIALLCGLALQLAGCAPPFPKELLERTDRKADLAELLADPDRFAGKLVLLGGTIVDTRNLREGTEIEVLQHPLDGEGRPRTGDETTGRFLAQTPRFLDAAVYHRGRSLTVIGEVAGTSVRKLGEIEYRYLVLQEKDLYLWPPSAGPRFSIGIGVYRGF
jgi:outer membrane lipoprotein